MPQPISESAIPEVIVKTTYPGHVVPNLLDYAGVRSVFSRDDAARGLSGLPAGGGINIAYLEGSA